MIVSPGSNGLLNRHERLRRLALPPAQDGDRLGEDAHLEQAVRDGARQPDRSRELGIEMDRVVVTGRVGVGVDLLLA